MKWTIILLASIGLVACTDDPSDSSDTTDAGPATINRPDVSIVEPPIVEMDPIPERVREVLESSIRNSRPGSDISALPDGVEIPSPPSSIDPGITLRPDPFRVEIDALIDGCSRFPAIPSSLTYRLVATGSDPSVPSVLSDLSITVYGVTEEEITNLDLEVPVLARSPNISGTINLAPRRSNTVRYGVVATRRSDGSYLGVGLVDVSPTPTIDFSAEFADKDFMVTESIEGRFHWALPVKLKNVGFPSIDFWRSTDPGQDNFRKFIDFDDPDASEQLPSDRLNGVLETTLVFPANDEDLARMGDSDITMTFPIVNRLSPCLNLNDSIRPLTTPPRLVTRLATPSDEVGETGSCSSETVSSECAGPPPETVCFARGTDFSVSGETSCRRGRLTCDTRGSRGEQWCDGPQDTIGAPGCGIGEGQLCRSDQECAPALFCSDFTSGGVTTKRCLPDETNRFDPERPVCELTPGTCWLPSELTSTDIALCRGLGSEPEIPEDFLACTPADEGSECMTESARCRGVSIPGTLECFATMKFCRATPKGMAICREAAR